MPDSSGELIDSSGNQNSSTSKKEADLQNLIAQATLQYSVKNYNAAAELYSEATELQAEINGEMSPENADLLYYYGRCLYHVGVSKSNVLGAKVAGEKGADGANTTKGKASNGQGSTSAPDAETRVAQEIVQKVVGEKDGMVPAVAENSTEGQPYFKFTGDENFDDSEDEDEVAKGNEPGGEEEAAEDDEFSIAFEVLDLARVLLVRKIEQRQENNGKGKGTGDAEGMRQIKERLADTHDLQAEIYLENERFPSAVTDLKSALSLKKELFPQDSSLIAEAHYKLSLALEFASVSTEKYEEGQDPATAKEAQVDEGTREAAVKEMEAAIESCKLRVARETEQLASTGSSQPPSQKEPITKESIDEVKEIISDMEQRLLDLRTPSVSIKDQTGPAGAPDGSDPLRGILGTLLGESPAAQQARVEEATKAATDLSGLVRRKKPGGPEEGGEASNDASDGNGKRKASLIDEVESVSDGKRAKVEDQTKH